MPDPQGPTGPSSSNPHMNLQSSMNATVSLSTDAAQEALQDLHKVLDNLTKSFGVNWDKTTKDSMAAQERFWTSVGDKAKAQHLMISRYSKEAISNIEAERDAKIAALNDELEHGKRTYKEIEVDREQTIKEAASRKIKIEQETNKKIAEDRGVGGLIRGKTAEFGAKIGGPVGGLISGAGELLTNPYALAAMALYEGFKTKAAFTKTGIELGQAGLGLGAGAGAGLNFNRRLFEGGVLGIGGNLDQALSQDEQRAIMSQMAGSRTMVGQATARGGFDAIRGNLGLFANVLPDASKEMELFTDATKNLGMSQKDIKNTFSDSVVNAKRLNITQLDAISAQMEMQKALRNITNDGTVAADVLNTVGGFFHDIGKSEAETQRMTLGVAQAGAALPLDKMLGMAAFVNGKMPTFQELTGLPATGIGPKNQGIMDNPFGLMGQFLTKVGGQSQDPMQKLLLANKLNQDLGLGIQTQDLPQLFKLASRIGQPGFNQADFAKQAEKLAGHNPAELAAEGMQHLASIVDPIKRLENTFSNFWTMLDARINIIIDNLKHPFGRHILSTRDIDVKHAPKKITKPSDYNG